jgi:hypothetical protein
LTVLGEATIPHIALDEQIVITAAFFNELADHSKA